MSKEEIEQLEQLVEQIESALPLLKESITKIKETEIGKDNIMNRPIMEVCSCSKYLSGRKLRRILESGCYEKGSATTIGEFVKVSRNTVLRYRFIGNKTVSEVQKVLKQNGVYW